MTDGTAVKLRCVESLRNRQHVWQHATDEDVGVVVPLRPAFANIDRFYVRVKFPNCPTHHRLLKDELLVVNG